MSKGAVIVGASSGVGRALAYQLAQGAWQLLIAARGKRDLDAIAHDLNFRFGSAVEVAEIDLADPEFDATAFHRLCQKRLESIDAVFLPAGAIDQCDEGPTRRSVMSRIVRVNYLAIIDLVATFSRSMGNGGSIVVFSSIASDAPRGKNTVYSSAKAGLEVFCRGLRHSLRDSKTQIKIYKLGYIDTAMTFGQKLLFPIAAPQHLAEHVVRGLHTKKFLTYYPGYWIVITWLLRQLPWIVYKRLNF